MSKKKAPIEVFYGPVGSFFSQKKRISVGNVKHSGDKKDISLVKPNPSHGVYSDMDSIFGNSGDDNISFGAGNGSFFGSVTNTLKARKATSNLVCGSFFGSIDYGMDENDSFALNINFSAIEEKSVTAKTQYIRKIFLSVNGFGGATTSSKFEGII
ncbi:hypothetical protein G9A89_009750 [Geosiphon pyriformis]|nr:hypothetical protein G9A89_009750 [Geosiphon pyriformis]